LAVKPTLVRATARTAAAAAAIARDSTDSATTAMTNMTSLGIPPQNLAVVQRGMFGAVNAPSGTAHAAALVMKDPDKRDWKMAGKTGSAQLRRISRAVRAKGEATSAQQGAMPWDLRDNGFFIAFAPAHAPRYAASCALEHGKAGANAAVLVKDVMEEVLRLDPSRKPRVDDQVAAAAPDKVPEKGPS
jgi:penicillin-binding protein 2